MTDVPKVRLAAACRDSTELQEVQAAEQTGRRPGVAETNITEPLGNSVACHSPSHLNTTVLLAVLHLVNRDHEKSHLLWVVAESTLST